MNSYPVELLAQLAPVMFVAGLGQPPVNSPSQSPDPTAQSIPSPKHQDQFTSLIFRLRETLLDQRKPAIWQPEKEKTFQVVLVDKDVRFPPRKLHPQEDHKNQTAHSPLSPLTASSPLHPDGLIAPIWIRKHTTLVPSVFVLFLSMFEYPPHSPRSPLDVPDLDRERQREQEERKNDMELAAEIAQRKKATNERGIKLTVVLIASRRMLDDPTLDTRLTYIRRQGGLDSRAALFVLSPVSQSELSEFVQSLQQALYESALEYYTSHSKRVRRKRNRHAQSGANYSAFIPPPSVGLSRPLRPEGWTVRYEYKMACFAELRGETEVALKHYQDAYAGLILMFGSVAMLPPRTKRWAEAKVLADCIDLKVCKLYLYNNEHSLALSFHNSHIRKFGDFSRVWGIGEDTFEFWSWVAKQQRVLAELLEQGTRSTLKIPVHRAAFSEHVSTQQSQQKSLIESDSMRALGLNPSHALQHPGFYYYMAARCTEKRREMFLALEVEGSSPEFKHPPGFANEQKIDHLALVLELYTRSYELFKKYTPSTTGQQSPGRLTLWIAYRIAQIYYESGKYNMAVKFFERIAKTYRREKWDSMLRPLLSTWYACAQQMGDIELSIRLLIEILGQNSETGEAEVTEEDLLTVLKSTVPTNPEEPLSVDLFESRSIFQSLVYFWDPQVFVGQTASFQLCVSTQPGVSLSALRFSSLAIYFCDEANTPVIVSSLTGPSKKIQRIDLGDVSAFLTASEGESQTVESGVDRRIIEADLQWSAESSIVFVGTISSNVPTIMKVAKVVVTLKEGSWWIDIPLFPSNSDTRNTSPPLIPRWLLCDDPVRFVAMIRGGYSTATVQHRPHNLIVTISHHGPAYVDEEHLIQIDITNLDDRELEVTIDVLLQPVESGDAVNLITFNENQSSGLIKGTRFGTMSPGANIVKTLYLLNRGPAGDRTIDISIQSKTTIPSPPSTLVKSATLDSPTPGSSLHDTNETLQTLVIPTVQAIKMNHAVTYQRSLHKQMGLSDLRTLEYDYWNDKFGGEASIMSTLRCLGPWSLRFESIRLEIKDNECAKLISPSVELLDEDDIALDWLPGDELGDFCKVSLCVPEGNTSSVAGPGCYTIAWRRLLPNGELGSLAKTTFPLPSLLPPGDELIALLHVPPMARLHVPLTMKLVIRNHHPSRTANIAVQLDPDISDGFVVTGLRAGRMPILLPDTECSVLWKLIPIDCGFIRLPKVKVMDLRKVATTPANAENATAEPTGESEAPGDVVKIVDLRWDRRDESGRGDNGDAEDNIGGILVLP